MTVSSDGESKRSRSLIKHQAADGLRWKNAGAAQLRVAVGFLAADHCELVTASAACEAFKTTLECLVIRDPNKPSRLQPFLCQPMVICGLKFMAKLQSLVEELEISKTGPSAEPISKLKTKISVLRERLDACFF